MKIQIRNETARFVIFFLAVLVSRIPFLADGFGLDGDSWAVAISASRLHDQGLYEVSRLPGYPVHEWLASLAISGGAFYENLLTALFSAIACLFFALTLKILRFRYVFLAASALAAVPVFYIHSTTTIDYNFALAFVMISLFFTVKDKCVWAGIFLGFAIGCRITSGAMVVPFSIMLLQADGLRANLIRILKITGLAVITGALIYLPVYLEYGSAFLTYYDVPYPPIPKVLYKLSIETWGTVGLLGLIISVGLLFLPDRITRKKFLFPRSVNEKYVVAWLVAIDLYIIAFLKLPMESGYLIPIIPFILLVMGKYLYTRAFSFLAISLIASPFVCTISPAERLDAATPSAASFAFRSSGENLEFDFLKGPVFSYKSRRQNGIRFSERILQSTDTVAQLSVLVSGRWYNELYYLSGDPDTLGVELESYLTEAAAVHYYAKGYRIYYLPKQEYYNRIMKGVDLSVYGAVPYLDEKKF